LALRLWGRFARHVTAIRHLLMAKELLRQAFPQEDVENIASRARREMAWQVRFAVTNVQRR